MKPGGTVLIVSGEASGDNYASMLVRELKRLRPNVRVLGVGGENLEKSGAELIEDYHRISVVGLTEVLSRLPAVLGLLKRIKKILSAREIGVVVLIDFPDFNFIVGRYARERGIPVIYYIPPQLWAWREGRVRKLKEMTDEVVVPFPFEEDFYRERGLEVRYFGHPLMEILSSSIEEFESGKRDEKCLTVGLFPGSRMSEIEKHLPLLLESVREISKKFDYVDFLMPVPSKEVRDSVLELLGEWRGEMQGVALDVVLKGPSDAFPSIDVAVASSGTVTLELALMGVPTVVIYKVSPVTYIIGKMLVKINNIALPNIVLGEEIFPELIQNDASPKMVSEKVVALVSDDQIRMKVKEGSIRLRNMLKGVGPSRALAGLIVERYL